MMKAVGPGLLALFVCLFTSPASAQLKPWCAQDLLGATQPYPAPKWSDLDKAAIPDYEDLAANFNITQSLRLLISTMEQTIAGIENGKSLAGAGDIDGFCLCDCNQDAAYWTNLLGTTVKSEAEAALHEAQDQYIARIQTKADAAQKTVYDAIPTFKAEVEKIALTTCEAMQSCDPKTGVPDTLYKDAGELAQKELKAKFLATLAENGIDDLRAEAKKLGDDATALLAKVAGGNWKTELASAENQAAFDSLKQRLEALIDKTINALKSTVVKLAEDLGPSIQHVVDVVLADLGKKLDADAKLWDTLEPQIKAVVDARVLAIKTSLTDVYDTAVDRDKVVDDFGKRLQSGLLQRFSTIKGCYGVTKRSACSSSAFCAGRPDGKKLFGRDELQLPLWMPTEAFKDGKTAARWALSALGWLEKVKQVFTSESTADATQRLRELVALLKNGQEILDQLNQYVNLYTDGYHQGAYSSIRSDLTSCTAWGGSGLMAEIFSTSSGDVRGGASYLSASLTKDRDIQYRSGGLGVYINGRHLPLAPGVSLNAGIDGWRLFDRHYPFGLGRGASTTGWQLDPGDLAVFNLVKKEDLQKNCCPAGQTNDCIPCPITASSFLHRGSYPVAYKSGGVARTWPRTGVAYENDERIAAVVGAGLNLELKMKTRYWSAAPIPIYIGTITPWLSLDAGVAWHYQAHRFRDMLREQINKGLPDSAKITDADFARDTEPFQAPDASLDASNGADIEPKLGADVVLGFNLARFLRVGITASLYVGVDVALEGAGGVIDLDRGLVDSLKQSNPEPKNCKPTIVESSTRVCSNELVKRKARCADVPADQRADCIDLSSTEPSGKLVSTGTYSCESGTCGQKGFCKEFAKIVAHDVTREQCETPVLASGSCIAPYRRSPSEPGGPESTNVDLVPFGPPAGLFWGFGYGDAQLALAQAEANRRTTQGECEAAGWCFNYKYAEGVDAEPNVYLGGYIGTAASRGQCPVARWRNIVDGPVIFKPDNKTPVPAQFIRFEWRPPAIGAGGTPKRTFFPYQCVDVPRVEVKGFEGTDCNPIAFGYPSACPGATCTCTPNGPPCPAGQTCVEGACVPRCTGDASCGEGKKCAGGGCVLANGVPYAEQVAYRMRSGSSPQHTVATYGLNKLITTVVAGVGVNAGIRYKLFRNWKERNLFDDKWKFDLFSFPGVKHQLGLESQYQNDCDVSGTVTNHQPALVKRQAGNVTSADFVKTCKPAMAADEQNPAEMPSVDESIGASVDATLKFGIDVGIDYWARGQLCIGGKTWDQYFASFENDPAALWKKLRCSYKVGTAVRPLDCTTGGALQTSLVRTLGCLDSALPANQALLQILPKTQSWLVAGSTDLDLSKLFADSEGEFERDNLEPELLQLNAAAVDAWLAALNQCVGDAPAGRFVDANLQITLDLKKEDFQPCGGSCCVDGICSDVKAPGECRGIFRPNAPCASAGACPVIDARPPRGACVVFGRCQEVVSAADCQGSYFHAGKTCGQLTPDEREQCIPMLANETATWSFDEAKSPASDSALTDNVATYFGRTTAQPGVSRNAVCFDGRDGYATAADHPELDFNGACPNAEPLFLAFWIRTTQGGVVPILDKRHSASNFLRGYHVVLANGRPGIQLATGPGSALCGTAATSACTNEFAPGSVADGYWHHIAIRVAPRCGPDAKGTIFVDGRAVHTFKPRQGELGNDAELTIARRNAFFAGNFFNGCLDELTIMKSAVSDDDVRALYGSGGRGRCRPRTCVLDAGLTSAFNIAQRRMVLAQTFTPEHTGYLTQVTHGLQTGGGLVASYDLLITTTTGTGLPSWSGGPYNVPNVLYSATGLTSFATTSVNGAVTVPAQLRVPLVAGVRYALVLVPKLPETGLMSWRGNSGANTYPRGAAYELSGSTWVIPTTMPKDHGFAIAGICQ